MKGLKLPSNFGELLRKARVKRKMTQSELAKQVGGIQQSTIAAYEQNKLTPKIHNLQKIIYLLQMDLKQLGLSEEVLSRLDNMDEFPTISLSQIPIFTMDSYALNIFGYDKNEFVNLKPCNLILSKHLDLFAVTIDKDDMRLSTIGNQCQASFPKNSIVTFSKTFCLESGKCYLVKLLGKHQITFKQLYFGDLKTTFRSLNSEYPSYELYQDQYEIIAQAVAVEITNI